MIDETVMPDLPPLIPARVACRTEGCGNVNLEIDVQLAGPEGVVFCGVCGEQITDVTLLDVEVPDAPPVA